ncbi:MULTISPECIES: TetR/AcrR family transcriptional regulator [Tsukamurella]|uniref:TetR/AcrR family transcriptional regulator n=2 Tax=Tsukamurella TaxID=2060 RepID=A0A5C5RWY9_9ACTN|nr:MULTISPECIES: TetR/AcrR family transcriptional regulator [Tsukamurella]NMD54756.1 TetR/AcrR family transcriptional regulator [Tsukamurella columbiensis]TWS27038.1 TetR/AcrR family transcriptional regulator [Tsukamurella conjunctivitidis]
MFSEPVQSRAEAKAGTRARVLAAADRSFRAHGFAGTTVRAIAADAGVSVGTVMAVGDKDALLIAIVDEWIAAVHTSRDAGKGLPALGRAEATARLVGIVAPFVTYFNADGDLSREYAAVLARGKHRSRTFGDLADELQSDFERIFAAAGCADPGAAARTLYFVYIGLLFATSGGAVTREAAAERLVEAIGQILGEGVSQ